MAGFNGLVLTKQGVKLMLKVHTNQCNMQLTRVAIGDGKLQHGYNLEDLTALLHETLSFGITKIEILDANCVRVETKINNTSLTEGLYIREIGLFAKEENGKEILYAVGNSKDTADYLPAKGTDVVEEIIGIGISVGNTSNLKLNVNESLWYISKKEFEENSLKNIEEHENIREQIDVLNTNIGDTTTLKTSSKEVVGAINKNVDEITDLQAKVSQCMSNIGGDNFLTEDILSNAGYPQPYVGSANNSATMPNTGQWRVMYIPYVAPSEGYSVQVAYGCVNNDTIWYRKSHGLVWNEWKQVATMETGAITIKQDLGITPIFITPKVTINGNMFTISGGLKLTKPLVDGTVVMSLPIGMYPSNPYHIFFNSWNYDIPYYCRLWVDTDGNIKIYGASQFPTQEIDLDFSRSVTF